MKFKAGKYYIGDPCYVLKETNGWSWDIVLDQTDYFQNYNGLIINLNGDSYPIACYSTRYGDGCYEDNAGRKYPVDAGCIACIPLEALGESPKFRKDLGHILDIPVDFEFEGRYGVYGICAIDWMLDTSDNEDN